MLKKIQTKWLLALAGLMMASPAMAELGLNLTRGVTEFSQEVYELHMVILWICVVIGVVVFGAMIYSMIKFRKSQGAVPATFTHSTKAEIIWTVIPILILLVMAYPATDALIKMEAPQAKPEMTVKITGFQWRWRYDYVGEDVGFISSLDEESNRVRQLGSSENPADVKDYLLNVDRELVLPVDTQIRFLITADDVIHAWWVPELGWKRDAIPGFVNEAWTNIKEPGVYRGQCAELCGRDHGFMPVVVRAVSKEEYRAWLNEQKQGQVAVDTAISASDKS